MLSRNVNRFDKKRKKIVRKEQKKVFLFGSYSCYSALISGRREPAELYLNERFVKENNSNSIWQKTIYEARRRDVPILYTSKKHLNNLVHVDNDQENDMVLKTTTLKYMQPQHNMFISTNEREICLALDRVQDPMNLGSIIRTCSYYGVSKLVVSQADTCPLSPVASYASNGVLEWFPTYSVPLMEGFLKQAATQGWDTIATTGLEKERFGCREVSDVDGLVLNKPTVLVMGSEGSGLSDEIVRNCSHITTVESFRNVMPCGLDSLNVSAATGVLLHILTSNFQRTSSRAPSIHQLSSVKVVR